ncbi:MAG: hypothetical protein IJZ53_04400 [Tyzzerella sp.]|nr:hypothetical protein [Tyzzerella sp.]
MKRKGIYIFLLLVATLVLSSCSAEIVAIDDCEWKMRSVMSNNIETAADADTSVLAVGETDELYPNAKIVEMTLVAENGKITITDATNDKTYSGTYKVIQKTPKSIDYEITIDGLNGYATVAPTEYYDGTEIPTLPINLGDYSLYFIPNK